MELLYLTDISQLQYKLQNNSSFPSGVIPMTGDLVVADELNRLNISYIDEWAYLDADDIQQNKKQAKSLASEWWKEIELNLDPTVIRLFEATSQDIFYSFEAAFNAYTVYEKILQTNKITNISGFFLPDQAIVRFGPIPTHRSVRSVAQAILFWIAEKNNIGLTTLDCPRPLSGGTLSKAGNLLGQIQRPQYNYVKKNAPKTIIVLTDGLNRFEYDTIKRICYESSDMELLALSLADLREDEFSKIEDDNDHLSKSWSVFCDSIMDYNGRYPEIFANPYFVFQFRGIWKEMRTANNYNKKFSAFLDIIQPNGVIFGHELFTIERMLVEAAKQRSIFTISLIHDGLGSVNCFEGIVGSADSLLVWSDLSYNVLKYYGVGEARIEKIGSVRYEKKYQDYIKTVPNSTEKKLAKKKIGVYPDSPVVLILTAAINTGFCMPMASPDKHLATIDQIVKLIQRRRDLHFIIKAHVSFDYYELYRKLNALNLPNLNFLESVTLDEALAASDMSLMINYFTTAALESMLTKVPVLYLNTAVYKLLEWDDILPQMTINRVSSVSELEVHIDKLIRDKEFYKSTLKEADSLVKMILDVGDQSAPIRLRNLLKEKIQSSSSANIQSILHALRGCKDIGKFIEHYKLTHHLFEDILYVLSFTAGCYNIKMSDFFKTFGQVSHDTEGSSGSHRSERKWLMTRAYVAGFNKKLPGKNTLSPLELVSYIRTHFRSFVSSSSETKRAFGHCLFRLVFFK